MLGIGPCEKRNWAKTEREARNVGCERGGRGECGQAQVKENCAKDKEKEHGDSEIMKKDPDPEVGPEVLDESDHASESDESCVTANGCGLYGNCGAVTECEDAKEQVEYDLYTSSALLSGPRRATCKSAPFLQILQPTSSGPLCLKEGQVS